MPHFGVSDGHDLGENASKNPENSSTSLCTPDVDELSFKNLCVDVYSRETGIVNRILVFFGLPAGNFLYNEGAVLLGMVYNFLPFMVLPIYTVLTKIDSSIVEAAEDLGANAITVFRRIIVPLSIPGIISGITMVFMPAVSTFVISALLGGGQFMLVGNLVEQQFLLVNNWHFGSAISMILMVLILISMAVLNRYDTSEVKDGGVSMI